MQEYAEIKKPFSVSDNDRGWETELVTFLQQNEGEKDHLKIHLLGIVLNGVFCLVRRPEEGENLQFLVNPRENEMLNRGFWKTSESALVEIKVIKQTSENTKI
jgi:hypothetical protein